MNEMCGSLGVHEFILARVRTSQATPQALLSCRLVLLPKLSCQLVN